MEELIGALTGVNLSEYQAEINEIRAEVGIQNTQQSTDFNAFAHTYVSAAITFDQDSFTANALGQLREHKSLLSERFGSLVGISPSYPTYEGAVRDGQKDQYNNNIGLDIGVWVKSRNLPRDVIRDLSLDALSQGMLLTTLNNPIINDAIDTYGEEIQFDFGIGVYDGPSQQTLVALAERFDTSTESLQNVNVVDVEITQNGTTVITTSNPGQWVEDGFDSDGDGDSDDDDREWGYGDPPPLRPENLGNGANEENASAKPVLLDLDGDGLEMVEGVGVTFDFDDDGYLERAAWWASPDDGFLVIDLDADGAFGTPDGEISFSRELTFGLWGQEGQTDLEVLAEARDSSGNLIFDSDGDGNLSSGDQHWSSFRVFRDLDLDGEVDAGELVTLGSLGITNIGLVYDNGDAYGDSSDSFGAKGFELFGTSTLIKDGVEVEGGVGDLAIAFDPSGHRVVSTSFGSRWEFQTGEEFNVRELDGTGSANVTISGNTYNGVYGDTRANTIDASGATQGILLDGGEGNDTVWGGSGSDVLTAGAGAAGGWQYADGNGGDDTYVYSRATHNLTITGENANQGEDTLVFSDLTMSDLNFRQLSNGTLEIYWQIDGEDGRVRITNDGEHIEKVATADGSVISDIRFHGPEHVSYGHVSFDGSDANDTIYSPDGMSYYLKGGLGDDVLVANTESDGVAFLSGREGNDTYIYHSDAGDAWVTSWGEAPGMGTDTFIFEDLTMADVSFRLDANYNAEQGDVLRVLYDDADGNAHMVSFANAGHQINSFQFADDTNIERITVDGWSEGRDVYSGGDGDDTIIGSSDTNIIYGHGGNDTLDAGGFSGSYQHLKGGEGDDTYLYSKANGRVFVGGEDANSGNDTIIFSDLTLADLTFEIVGADEALLLRWSENGTSGFIRIDDRGDHIEKFQFADGTILSKIDVDAWSAGRDVFLGTQGDDLIIGSAQTEIIYGLSGDDTLDSGASSGSYQHLRGGWGDDTYLYGKISEKVFISRTGEDENTGTDTLVFKDLNLEDINASIRYNAGSDYGDTLHLSWSDGGNSGYVDIADRGMHIEQYVFQDGTTMTFDEFVFT